MKLIAIAIFVAAFSEAGATAQVQERAAPEIIITADGVLNSPWVEKRTCGESGCRVLIYNTETHEIARVDGRLTSLFRLTGAGEEVARLKLDSN